MNFEREYPLPDGEYKTKVTHVKPMIADLFMIEFEVIEGKYQGRKMWRKIDFDSKRSILNLLILVGLKEINDTDQLIGCEAQITLNYGCGYKTHRSFKEKYGFEDLTEELSEPDEDDLKEIMDNVDSLVGVFGVDREKALIMAAFTKGEENARNNYDY